ncbi:alpha-amylase family glycosyl hydrolase [Salinispira pacifica]|nr:alpha-amylase family glycosyl hydrolase [Salinispira pacifica]
MLMTQPALARHEGLIYHVFPLGQTGAAKSSREAFSTAKNIREFAGWIPHLKDIGVDAVLFGPLTHSGSHGYDTVDLLSIDPRLGTREDVKWLFDRLHEADIAVVLDAVFNHVGREFSAFRDLAQRREDSPYLNWFSDVNFQADSPFGDGFSYGTWDGHASLVKLNVLNPEVQKYLWSALEFWIMDLGIDGLRMDAADVISPEIWPLLRKTADDMYRNRTDAVGRPPFTREGFWIMGEMVFGNYADICAPGMLDSITNYELYKGLHSSHNDGNYFELAWTLKRQFGEQGIYRDLKLYTFADNHDVSRIASILDRPEHIYPLHILLFTVPGLPSLYYGSETGVPGSKGRDDWELRPVLDHSELQIHGSHGDLLYEITRLREIRARTPALRDGEYRELSVDHRLFAFSRVLSPENSHGEAGDECIVAVNSDESTRTLSIPAERLQGSRYRDLLNGGDVVQIFTREDGLRVLELPVHPCWGAVLQRIE